jgi:uncharacterized protein YkwD
MKPTSFFRNRRASNVFATFSTFLLAVCLLLPSLLNSSLAKAGDNVWDLVDAMNQARQENGLAPLQTDQRLLNSSATHARDMAQRNYFSHFTPEGWDAGLRIYGWGYPRSAGIGENIAGGHPDPWSVVQGWLASPGHRANLLNPAYKTVGAGHYYQPGSTYVNYWVGHYGTQ